MRSIGDVIAGLLGRGDHAWVGFEEFLGPDADNLRRLQRMGFVSADALVHPAPTCPHCGEGMPDRIGTRFLCSACRSDIDPQTVFVWPLRAERFFEWLAAEWKLTGRHQQLDPTTWQLGTWIADGHRTECFFRVSEPASESARQRIGAYQNVLILTGREAESPINRSPGITLPLAGVIRDAEVVGVHDLSDLLRPRGNVRFDPHSGTVWLGPTWMGEVPVGSKEFHFLDRLAQEIDRFVPYADLKRHVLRQATSIDQTEEATFCQRLKSRIKKQWVAKIDALVATSNKGDGYRLREYGEL